MLDRERRCRPCIARRTATYRIHDDQGRRTLARQHAVDLLRCSQLFKAQASQLLAHRAHHFRVVHWDVQIAHALLAALRACGTCLTSNKLITSSREAVPEGGAGCYFLRNAESAARKSGVLRLTALTSAPSRKPSSKLTPSSW